MAHRILVVESAFGFGGSIVALGRLLRGLPRGEFEVRTLVRFPAQAEALRRTAGVPVDVRVVPLAAKRAAASRGFAARVQGAADHLRRHLRYAREIRREAAEFRPDVLQANNSVTSNFGVLLAARRLKLPCVVRQQGYEWRSWDVRRLARGVTAFLVNSEDVARDVEALGVPRSRIAVTWCPVETAEYDAPVDRAAVRAEIGVPADAPVALMVGMLLPGKGQHVFLRAMVDVLRAVPSAYGVVVGGVPEDADLDYAGELRAMADRLGVAGRIVFTGFRQDIPRLLAAADVCVHASVHPEPFGMVVAEAMAARRPVVASAVAGPPEQVDEGRSGFLVTPGDVAAYADRIARLLLDRELARSFGERGRAIVEDRFSLARHAALTAEAYRRVLRGGFSD